MGPETQLRNAKEVNRKSLQEGRGKNFEDPESSAKQSSSTSRWADVGAKYGLILAWLVVIAVFSALRPEIFFTAANFQTMLGSQAVLLILTLGLLLPLTAGEFDLSIAGVMNISVVMVGYLNVLHEWPIAAAIVASLFIGLLVGLVNVFFVLFVRIDSIVVTLGTGTILGGLAFGINTQAVTGISEMFVSFTRHRFLGIQLAFFIGLALVVLIWYIMAHTPLGRYLYFVGAGREVARLAGIRVNVVRGASLVVASLFGAVAGVIQVGLLGASDPHVGPGFLLPAFAAAFLGSTVIAPGRFNPWGSFIAVYFLVTGITGLQIMGLSGWIEQVFYGTSLVLGVAFSRLLGRRKERI